MAIKKVLVVDDSPTEALHLSEILGKNGFKVTVAADSEQAMTKLEAETFDLILMDVVMPGQNGYQATRAIKKDERFQGIALTTGDVVTRVNGQSVERPEQAFQVWDSLRVASALVVEFEREGETHTMRYEIVD